MGFFKAIFNSLTNSKSWKEEGERAISATSFFSLNALPAARRMIDTGDYERAHFLLNKALLQFFVYEHPMIKEARDEAQRLHKITSAHVKQTDSNTSSSKYTEVAGAIDYLNSVNTYEGSNARDVFDKNNVARAVKAIEKFKAANYLREGLASQWGDNAILAEIIRLCQLALRKDKKNGDAHVLLAKTYFALAFNVGSDALHRKCISYSAAVIVVWESKMMGSTERPLGKPLYEAVITYLHNLYPDIPTSSLSDIAKYEYESAVNPDNYYQLEKLLNV
jgi:hypothetical protein